MTPTQTAVLLALRQVTRRYAGRPLPEWDEFARSTRLVVVDAKEKVPTGSHDVFVVARGVLKLVNSEGGPDNGRVEEFFEAVTVVAPALRPAWAERTAPPIPFVRWRGREWSLPQTELYALERCRLVWFDFRVVERLAARHPEWGQVMSAFLWTYLDGIYASGRAKAGGAAEARYRDLVEHRSSLLNRVMQRDLASYLNVSEESLSRIAKRVRAGAAETDPTGPGTQA